jgi:hypothetical protein
MTRIQIHDLAATEELTSDEQRQVLGGWFAIAGAFRSLRTTTVTDPERMIDRLDTSLDRLESGLS